MTAADVRTHPAPRLAQQGDMAGCAAVVNRWIDGTAWFPRTVSGPQIAARLQGALARRVIWVIGDPVIAYLSLDPETGHIGALYSDLCGQGLGKTLMSCAKAGREALSLNTHVANLAAQRFYRREGFVPVSEHDPEPPETQRELRMEWRRAT